MENGAIVHKPVMWREVLDLAGKCVGTGDNIFLDCTLGEGGHSELILEKYPELKVIGFDRDAEIQGIAKRRLEKFGDRISLINSNFSEMKDFLPDMEGRISGMLFDFGISSYHFDKSGRGFSFSRDEALDMRLDKNKKLNAAYIVNNYTEEKLTDIFYKYGQERWAKKIAERICEARKDNPIETGPALAEIVKSAIPRKFHVRNIHPATRIFQAIRIEVNDELGAIRSTLAEAYKYLAKGGMMIAISFHSLEDGIVKDIFRRLSKGCICGLSSYDCICENEPFVSLVFKKPLTADEEEVKENPRSRSAKLRAAVRN